MVSIKIHVPLNNVPLLVTPQLALELHNRKAIQKTRSPKVYRATDFDHFWRSMREATGVSE